MIDEAAALRAPLIGKVEAVALVVDPAEDVLAQIVETVRPEAIQFHGGESPAALARVKDKWGDQVEVWKALGIAAPSDLDVASDFHDIVDRLLFDARPPKAADRPGGHGDVFDWSIMAAYAGEAPWLLAGGLTPENVGAAIAACRAIPEFDGVDVSSGVETAPGEKDVAAIARFCAAAQDALLKGDGA